MEFTNEELANEEWRDVVGYEGKYQVSNLGRVRNFKNFNVIDGWTTRSGYISVHLSNQGKPRKKSVHRLVAMAFISNPLSKPHIDHINCNRQDNRVENLRWCTHKENMNNPITLETIRKSKVGVKNPMYGKVTPQSVKDKIREALSGAKNHMYGKHLTEEQKDKIKEWNKTEDAIRLRCVPVLQFTKDMELVKIWFSARQAHRECGYNHGCIQRCCKGIRKTYRGYIWQYPENNKETFDLIFNKVFATRL